MISTKRPIQERPVFGNLLFSQCWEDPALDIETLRPGPGRRLLVVTSGGCTALSLLASEPGEVVALDLNPVQSHLLELKRAGIRGLSHEGLLKLLGARFLEEPDPAGPDREVLYGKVRHLLSPAAREFWDSRIPEVRRGVLQAGRYERFLGKFRRFLGILMGRRNLDALVRLPLTRQEEFYRTSWDRPAWRLLFRVFFSRAVLGRKGLDPEFFRFVSGVPSFGERFRRRAEHALTRIPVRDNYFLAQIVHGRYRDRRAVPPYLHPKNFGALRRSAGRLRIVTSELGRFLAGCPADSFDGFALSNVFEWVDEETFESLLREVCRTARPGAKLLYRNLLVERERPPCLAEKLRSHREEGRRLLDRDRSFVYRRVVVEEVKHA